MSSSWPPAPLRAEFRPQRIPGHDFRVRVDLRGLAEHRLQSAGAAGVRTRRADDQHAGAKAPVPGVCRIVEISNFARLRAKARPTT
jgi:hypothetical protein